MTFYLLLCNVLFISIVFNSDVTAGKTAIENKTISENQDSHKLLTNQTKVALLSEGGSILPETLLMALPKTNSTITSLGNEVSKNKVVPRKGVIYSDNSTKPHDVLLQSSEKSISQSSVDKPKTLNEQLKSTTSVTNGKSTLEDIHNIPKNVDTEVHKKPLILHSDALENMTVKSSSGTLVKDQIQSPKDVKTYLTNVNKHPGMVMPLVITILLVPMFAVLGYMALRRGQEAWKNRHYKRMDFLLDGMYND